ncbi:YLP motif-containing protein 1-like [Diaphorina citri]|uniref:YLP motif-containing protein 1-like n=1 Tax=Diaphorina citri TaxID=121845 RepID=A0A3Q0IJD3_DIACI|nr:YLP motif-containing protein 1-like [Diaphorina citri]
MYHSRTVLDKNRSKRITFLRHKFFTRSQKEESIEDFVASLNKLSLDCEFKDLREGLVKDILILGLKNNQLKERLLRESDLKLDKAVMLCKAVEATAGHMREMDPCSIKEEPVFLVKKNFKKAVVCFKFVIILNVFKSLFCPFISGELDHLFRDQSTRIGTAWSRVANRMAEEGYPLPCANPGKRCNQKWRNLEKVYRKHSSYLAGRLPGTTGTAPIPTPQYFEEISSILGHSHAAHPVIQVDSLAPAPVTTPAPSTVTSFHPLSSSTVASAPVVPPVPTPQPLRFVRLPSSLLQTLSQSQVFPSGPPPPPPPPAFSPPPPPHSLESTFNMSPERPISSPSPPHFSHYIPISSLIRSHSPPPSPIHSHSSSLHSQIITRPAPTITQPPQTITRPPQTITRPLQTITRPPQAPRFVRLLSSLFQTLSRSQVLPSGPAVSPPPAFSPPPHSPESTFDMSFPRKFRMGNFKFEGFGTVRLLLIQFPLYLRMSSFLTQILSLPRLLIFLMNPP